MAKKTESKEFPKISVLERRLQHPFGAPSVPITLKDGQRWAIRWANDHVRSGRVHQILQMGWTFVTPEEIEGRAADFGFRVLDGRIVRGEHGEEVLVKMPQRDFDLIQKAKAQKNLEGLGGRKAVDDIANRTAAKFGDEAAETVSRSEITVTDSRIAIDLEEEAAS